MKEKVKRFMKKAPSDIPLRRTPPLIAQLLYRHARNSATFSHFPQLSHSTVTPATAPSYPVSPTDFTQKSPHRTRAPSP